MPCNHIIKRHHILWKPESLCKLWKFQQRPLDTHPRAPDRSVVHFHLGARPHPTGACFFFASPLRSVPSRAGGASVSSPPDLRPLPLDVKGSEHSSAPQRRRALPERHRPPPPRLCSVRDGQQHRRLHQRCLPRVSAGSTSASSLKSQGSPPPSSQGHGAAQQCRRPPPK